MKVRTLQRRVRTWARWDNPPEFNIYYHLGHIGSEVSECYEAVREGHLKQHRKGKPYDPARIIWKGKKPDGLPAELADVVIQAAKVAEICGIDLEAAIEEKMKYNEARRQA